jgi:putative transposase
MAVSARPPIRILDSHTRSSTSPHPDQVGVADITCVRLREEFVYLAVVMDVFTRRVRGWELGRGLDQGLTLAALKRAMRNRRRPEVHHSDQGV